MDVNLVVVCRTDLASSLDCLKSILGAGVDSSVRLFLIDLLQEKAASEQLRAAFPPTRHLTWVDQTDRNELEVSFLFGHIRAPITVTIFDNVLVANDWLRRLILPFRVSDRVECVIPMAGCGPKFGLALPPGETFSTFDAAIAHFSRREFPIAPRMELRYCCIAWRTVDIAEAGNLNIALRRLARTHSAPVIADNVYVHASGCYPVECANNQRFPWLLRTRFDQIPPEYVRTAFASGWRWAPLQHSREVYRDLRRRVRAHDYTGAVRVALRGLIALPGAGEPLALTERLRGPRDPSRLRVTYVLPSVTIAGGVVSVMQLVNQLALLGIDVRLVCLHQYRETKLWRSYCRPIVFRNAKELVSRFPRSDIAVATHWTTAAWVRDAKLAGRANKAVYFLQDYEPWFFPSSRPDKRSAVRKTYEMIDHRIVKSDWLKSLLRSRGYNTRKINFGLDLSVFYPRRCAATKSGALTILAMARPRTPRRGFSTLCQALRLISACRPETRIVLFGDDLTGFDLPFPYEDVGVVEEQEDMAKLCSSADIFIDASDFQGFGRTALEAMATHTACILTDVGGVREYAVDGVNCIMVKPNDPTAIMEAFLSLHTNPELLDRVAKEGLGTAQRYCHRKEAERTLDYFNSLMSASQASSGQTS